jgi:magnesium chelatase family protein
MLNASIPGSQLDALAPVDDAGRTMLRTLLERDSLTGRGYHRVRRVARTIADLDGEHEVVRDTHVALALQLRVSLKVSTRWQAA